jgi:hypothetical protein
MNPRKHCSCWAIFFQHWFLDQCTLMSREQVMSDQQVSGTPCKLIPALHVCYYQIMISWVQGETLNSWQPMPHSEMKRGMFCLWVPDSRCTKACGQYKPLDMVASDKSMFGIPHPDKLRSSMFCCCPCVHFPQATLNWENFHTKQGYLPLAFSFDWLSYHSNRPDGSSLLHSQVLGICAHCDITPILFWLVRQHKHTC